MHKIIIIIIMKAKMKKKMKKKMNKMNKIIKDKESKVVTNR